jgi:hypothetical protein
MKNSPSVLDNDLEVILSSEFDSRLDVLDITGINTDRRDATLFTRLSKGGI